MDSRGTRVARGTRVSMKPELRCSSSETSPLLVLRSCVEGRDSTFRGHPFGVLHRALPRDHGVVIHGGSSGPTTAAPIPWERSREVLSARRRSSGSPGASREVPTSGRHGPAKVGDLTDFCPHPMGGSKRTKVREIPHPSEGAGQVGEAALIGELEIARSGAPGAPVGAAGATSTGTPTCGRGRDVGAHGGRRPRPPRASRRAGRRRAPPADIADIADMLRPLVKSGEPGARPERPASAGGPGRSGGVPRGDAPRPLSGRAAVLRATQVPVC